MLAEKSIALSIKNLSVGYDRPLIKNLTLDIMQGEITCIVGESGCGKSTLLKHLFGLQAPLYGEIWFGQTRQEEGKYPVLVQKKMGILFQNGALWSAMSVEENLALPLRFYTSFDAQTMLYWVRFYLSVVGLSGYEAHMPSELSGGMRKRAALARALVLEPSIVFLDEPSAGLDPLNIRKLDELILFIKAHFKTTIVVVSHELNSIFRIADTVIFLDREKAQLLDAGKPEYLRRYSAHSKIREFFAYDSNISSPVL